MKRISKTPKALLLAVLAGSVLAAYITLVTPRRALRCLPAAARTLARAYADNQLAANPPRLLPGNRVRLLVNGNEALPAMLNLVDSAQHTIRMQVMLFFPDEAGFTLARALARAARRGVQVQLSFNIDQTANGTLADAYPREKKERLNALMTRMLEELRQAGVEVRANPAGIDFPLQQASPRARAVMQSIERNACVAANHYDHRKLLIVDGAQAVIGGMNVGSAYLYQVAPDPQQDMLEETAQRNHQGLPEAFDKWFDAALWVQGPVAAEMVEEFNWRWEVLGGAALPPEAVQAHPGGSPAALLVQRPGTPQAGAQILAMIRQAQREIYIASPYVSYEPALRALQEAAQRGVRVVFVVPGARQEMAISGRIMHAEAPALVSSGVEVYFNDLRMAHTKIMVVDGSQVVAGSFNLNHRSFRHDLETVALVEDPTLAAEVIERVFVPYLSLSRRASPDPRPPLNLLDWFLQPFT